MVANPLLGCHKHICGLSFRTLHIKDYSLSVQTSSHFSLLSDIQDAINPDSSRLCSSIWVLGRCDWSHSLCRSPCSQPGFGARLSRQGVGTRCANGGVARGALRERVWQGYVRGSSRSRPQRLGRLERKHARCVRAVTPFLRAMLMAIKVLLEEFILQQSFSTMVPTPHLTTSSFLQRLLPSTLWTVPTIHQRSPVSSSAQRPHQLPWSLQTRRLR